MLSVYTWQGANVNRRDAARMANNGIAATSLEGVGPGQVQLGIGDLHARIGIVHPGRQGTSGYFVTLQN